MRNLLVLVAFLFALNSSAQEITTYHELENGLAKVVVYNGEKIVQQGFVKKDGNRWINTGRWVQYDLDGNITLEVKYREGKREETIAYQNNRVIKVYRKN